MAQKMVLSEEHAVELLAFFITAARCLLDEPADYGSLRLLDAAERLAIFAQAQASPAAQALFTQVIEESPRIQGTINQRAQFAALLDSLCSDVAQTLVAASRLEQGAG